jgi:hypothetical protein
VAVDYQVTLKLMINCTLTGGEFVKLFMKIWEGKSYVGCLVQTVSQMSKRSTEAQHWKTWHIGPIHAVALFVTLPRYTVLSCVYPSDHTCVNSRLCFFGIHSSKMACLCRAQYFNQLLIILLGCK